MARSQRVDARSDIIEIPQLAVSGSMGQGALPPDHVDVVKHVIASATALRALCTFSDPRKLQIITGYGPSMEPTFKDGDPLLIDTAITTVELDAIYVFTFKGEMFIKSIQRVPGDGLLVISHNEKVAKPWSIRLDDLDSHLFVHGRVILAWNSRRF